MSAEEPQSNLAREPSTAPKSQTDTAKKRPRKAAEPKSRRKAGMYIICYASGPAECSCRRCSRQARVCRRRSCSEQFGSDSRRIPPSALPSAVYHESAAKLSLERLSVHASSSASRLSTTIFPPAERPANAGSSVQLCNAHRLSSSPSWISLPVSSSVGCHVWFAT